MTPILAAQALHDLNSGQAHVWTVDLRQAAAIDVDVLSSDERARADRMRHAAERRRFIVARVALRRLLGERLGLAPQAVRLVLGEHGKPRLDAGGPHFNLTHSGDLALIALCSNYPLGVDVEQAGQGLSALDDIASTYFSRAERAGYFALPPARRGQAFHRVWTRKEAVAKALGLGMALAGPSFDVSLEEGAPHLLRLGEDLSPTPWTLIDLDLPDGYFGAVAAPAAGLILQRLNPTGR
ncbi:MAG: 4'-phosphopantetheinyl transferase family protein [Caulobacteraceae bacterium]